MNVRAMYSHVQSGGNAAVVAEHANLVKRIAFHLMNRLPDHVQVDDLIQSGMIGLLDAARLFDASHGASFETYAGIRIRGAMLDELRRNDWTPRSVHRRHREIAQAVREIEAQTGAEAKDSDVCAKLGISLDEYFDAIHDFAQVRLTPLDHSGDDHDETLDIADHGNQPDQHLSQERFSADLAEHIAALPERERLVMSLYYVDELNQKEIGAVLGVSESRVCQIQSKAILRLKSAMQDWR
ncbi:MAG: RNA polymerase sigma factor FliA [Halothiobacillus sp. 24-54-40]|jgi:RNA polymerase sigma factor for flagellar operon FliA|nr:MAG: RNA polymerase sigma factor FliA [Halothiobacillus sp. 35-54-62]OYZ87352.1 MAG: RNA polymerase sigma factor FliA [Halothiobacillus sp. 24-54-40]OZA80799.1 MAG: RNA polymerase sigma factor FliA [Halothiobacillus sp. 39-53-45]HQS02079.1 RNA polymerase sigma factor FliA [Halothiobacillus sp.]HQS28657.1 RNA polymerase sigma factor FliA [Halothiobacillus sp.]